MRYRVQVVGLGQGLKFLFLEQGKEVSICIFIVYVDNVCGSGGGVGS